MNSLVRDNLIVLRENLARAIPPSDALPDCVGGFELCEGLWRFFSNAWPNGGIRLWNEKNPWSAYWGPLLPSGFYSFGEDVFGNQLALLRNHHQVFLWNHENGECHDLLVGPLELLETVFESGVEWIDFYQDGSTSVARSFGRVPKDSHLHWTTPLILGGQVSLENVTVVGREAHLVGHAKLWFQVSGIPPGNAVLPQG
jgi:hypothetical protein